LFFHDSAASPSYLLEGYYIYFISTKLFYKHLLTLLLYTVNEHSRCQCLILICFMSLAVDLGVLLRVIAETSIQLHFLDVS
jgi:hypothetical protein